MESDCTHNEGVSLLFGHPECVPVTSQMAFKLSQEMVCMATWPVDNYRFAMLRKGGDDSLPERSFTCMRVKFDVENEVRRQANHCHL